jgi:hypothetical protein
LFALDQSRTKCFKLCLTLFEEPQPCRHHVRCRAVSTLSDLSLNEVGEVIANCD